jgi:hypothetical protein
MEKESLLIVVFRLAREVGAARFAQGLLVVNFDLFIVVVACHLSYVE